MTLECLCSGAMAGYQKVKCDMCQRNNGPASVAAMVEATFPHRTERFLTMLQGDPRIAFCHTLDQIGALGLPENIVFLSDGYMGENMPEDYARGQLALDFKDNPLSSVREILSVEGINVRTGNKYSILVPYGYGDNGMPEFDSPMASPSQSSGFFVEILSQWRSGMLARRKRRRR
jgi:hypothetical protein